MDFSISKWFAALFALALLSACGGHGGSIPATGGGASRQSLAQATLRVTIPAKKASAGSTRRPAYVSYSTASVTLSYTIGSTTYPAQTVNTSITSPNCTPDQNYNFTCTLTFGASAGAATYTVSAYDGPNGTGKLLSTATSSMTIVAGRDNQFNVTLNGVVGGFNLAFTTPSNDGTTIPAGTPADVPIAVNATDSDFGVILNSPQLLFPDGTPVTAATLTIGGDPGEFSLKQNGTTLTPASGTTYKIAAPFTGLSLHYNGGLYQNVSVTVSAQSATGQAQLVIQPVLTEFAVPSGFVEEGNLAAGPDGNIWFTEVEQAGGGVGKIAPSGTVTEYPTQGNALVWGITSANGKLWLSENGNCPASASNLCGIQEMATDGSIVGRFAVYHGSCDPYPGLLTTDLSGNVWYDNSPCGVIGYLPSKDPSSEQHFDVGSNAWGFTSGADGNVWFVAYNGNNSFAAGSISASGATQTYPLPQTGAGNAPQTLASRPSDKSVWVDHQVGSFDSIASASGAVSTHTNGLGQSVIAAGNDGNIYAMVSDGSGVFEFDSVAQDGTIGRSFFYGSPALLVVPESIVAGPPGSNTFWFIDNNTGKIARITLGG